MKGGLGIQLHQNHDSVTLDKHKCYSNREHILNCAFLYVKKKRWYWINASSDVTHDTQVVFKLRICNPQ